jgi:hypothetical protein
MLHLFTTDIVCPTKLRFPTVRAGEEILGADRKWVTLMIGGVPLQSNDKCNTYMKNFTQISKNVAPDEKASNLHINSHDNGS